MSWYPRACVVCHGDMYDDALDEGWRVCMMCGRSFAAKDLITLRKAPIMFSARKRTESLEKAA